MTRTIETRKCRVCGTLLPPPRTANDRARRYCSAPCRRSAEYARVKARREASLSGRKCQHCDAEIPRGSNAARQYCSSECRSAAKQARATAARAGIKWCVECHGEIPRERAQHSRVKYCSQRCAARRAGREKYRRKRAARLAAEAQQQKVLEERGVPWREVIARARAADPHLGAALLESLNAHRRRNGRPEVRA